MVRSMEQAAKCANSSLVITQALLVQISSCDVSCGDCCFPSNTLQNDCRDDCRNTCPCCYCDGKACSNGSSRLLVLAASPCCCAAGSRAQLPCCARWNDLRYAVVACRAAWRVQSWERWVYASCWLLCLGGAWVTTWPANEYLRDLGRLECRCARVPATQT